MSAPTLDERIEWVKLHHFEVIPPAGRVPNYCWRCSSDWPCTTSQLATAAEKLKEALYCVVHRCEAEGCGTAWAPLHDAKRLLEEL